MLLLADSCLSPRAAIDPKQSPESAVEIKGIGWANIEFLVSEVREVMRFSKKLLESGKDLPVTFNP